MDNQPNGTSETTPEQTPLPTPAPAASAVPPKVEQPGEKPGAPVIPKSVEEVKPKRSYSEEEWNKRQSAWDRTFSEKESSWKTTTQTLESKLAQLEEQVVESRTASFVSQVEQAGGDVEVAKRIVARERDIARKELEIAKRERRAAEAEQQLTVAAKGKRAYELAKQYELDEKEDLPSLLEAGDEVSMENIALKLHVGKVTAQIRPVTTPAPTPQTGNRGADISKMSVRQRLGWAADQGV